MKISENQIQQAVLDLAQQRGENKSCAPDEVARSLIGKDEKKWRLLMKPIRSEIVKLANEGQLQILRKGKVVDPENFKGIYRYCLSQNNEEMPS